MKNNSTHTPRSWVAGILALAGCGADEIVSPATSRRQIINKSGADGTTHLDSGYDPVAGHHRPQAGPTNNSTPRPETFGAPRRSDRRKYRVCTCLGMFDTDGSLPNQVHPACSICHERPGERTAKTKASNSTDTESTLAIRTRCDHLRCDPVVPSSSSNRGATRKFEADGSVDAPNHLDQAATTSSASRR